MTVLPMMCQMCESRYAETVISFTWQTVGMDGEFGFKTRNVCCCDGCFLRTTHEMSIAAKCIAKEIMREKEKGEKE